ncbi:NfrA family protein [Hyphobacterium marinum]|uniref:Tetratricopeptide repeat protein n=1 Tax=Hyphobacterium marinum TaxID=3116574 RepID=A0ABU7LZZ4_9PROT|nr:tetratricopeptide repeat protein [Hyphobacterium sp. Y6023]MEE2567095.1 tetratricopeptide repeat protein [Hyphobacterium sp. Y6023]
MLHSKPMTAPKSLIRTRRNLLASVTFASLTILAVSAGASPQDGEIASARMTAQSAVQSGDCVEAYEIYARVAVQGGRALDFVAAGECAVRLGRPADAAHAFWNAAERIDQLDDAQALYVLRSLAYQAEAAGQLPRSRMAWDRVANRSGESGDRVMAARAARLDGRGGAAGAQLNRVNAADLSGAALATYYEEMARSLAEQQPSAAAMYFERAIAVEDAAYRQFELALLLDRAGRGADAARAFETALAREPDNVDILLSAGYSARRNGRNEDAARYFERAMALDPDREGLAEDLGYALKDADDEAGAASAFRLAVDRLLDDPSADPGQTYRLRREIEELEDNRYAYAFLSYRDTGAGNGPNLPELGPVESQIGGEFGWRPDALNGQGTGVTLYGRGYASLGGRDFSLDEDSLQLGVGARWKPFAQQDINLSVERLIAGGDLARDAWLLRASAGWSDGLDWNPAEDSWNYTALYGDLAYIPDDPEYFSAYASVRQGRRFRTGDGWAVTPYVVGVAQYSEDGFANRDRFEAGAGVAVSRWLDQDRYRAYRQRIDFELEYRFGLGDDDEDAAIARVIWNF